MGEPRLLCEVLWREIVRVNEIFVSIQGEGIHAGEVMSFIRLSGCNLRCSWCDTKYAQDLEGEAELLFSENINPSTDWVCITGGEPLLQADDVAALALKLCLRGKHVEIETNGSILPPLWAFAGISTNAYKPLIDSWVVDIKLPSSGNPSSEDIIKGWTDEMRDSDQIKLVVADEQDLDSAQYWINLIRSSKAVILVSPVILGTTRDIWLQRVAEFCIENKLRLSLQLHKVIWGNKKGV